MADDEAPGSSTGFPPASGATQPDPEVSPQNGSRAGLSYTDDAIADALAADLARTATGSVPIVFPQPDRPTRVSLADEELMSALADAQNEAAGTLAKIEQLQEQMRLREDEALQFRIWENSMLAIGTPEALTALEQARAEFRGIVPPATVAIAPSSTEESTNHTQGIVEVEAEPSLETEPARERETPAAEPAELEASETVPQMMPETLPEPSAETVVETAAPAVGPFFDEETADPLLEPETRAETHEQSERLKDLLAAAAAATAAIETGATGAGVEELEDATTPLDARVRGGSTRVQKPSFGRLELFGVTAVPEMLREGSSVRLLWLNFAAGSSVLGIAVGAAILGLGLSVRQALLAIIIGLALAAVTVATASVAGRRNGQPLPIQTRATFGRIGNALPATVLLIGRLFWAAVPIWLVGVSVTAVLTAAGFSLPLAAPWFALSVSAAVAVLVAVFVVFGYGMIAWLQLAVSSVSAILVTALIAATWSSADLSAVLSISDGPWFLLVSGIVIVFCLVGLGWGLSVADLARYSGSGNRALGGSVWAAVGTVVPSLALFSWGVILAASDAELTQAISALGPIALTSALPLWYPVPLLAAIVLPLLSLAVGSSYSAGFTVQALLPVRRIPAAVIAMILVLGLTTSVSWLQILLPDLDIPATIRDLVVTLGVPLAAVLGVFVAETSIRRSSLDAISLLGRGIYPAVRWVNLIGFVVASGVGFGFVTAQSAWLDVWQGYGLALAGLPDDSLFATSNAGVLMAFGIALLVPVIAGIPAIRRQESDAGWRE